MPSTRMDFLKTMKRCLELFLLYAKHTAHKPAEWDRPPAAAGAMAVPG